MDSEQMIEQQMLAEMQAQEHAAAKEKDMKIDLLFDLSLQVSIELGRTKMLIKDILELQRGSVIELEKLASEPVDILVNGKKVAEGEVVVIEKHFGIRITSLIESADRLKNLGA
jgi:flagellar motor switch protein FliN/FliY